VAISRSSGVFLHPTSLPGGKLDGEAYAFVDWLAAAGQSWWQVLPLGPPDEFGSPYRATSAFAGWAGLLAEPEAPVSSEELEDFVARHAFWIGEWARFAGPHAIADQVRFEREWSALRGYARAHGVGLVGDVPIYVSDIGADVRAWPELFAHGEVAGAPPDALSASGQRWGNPLYDWPAHRATGYRWWIERFRRAAELVDLARVDHFRGFVSYWAVPERHKTARRGHWRPGPGRELFDAVRDALGALPVIAEDLGVITPAVHRLRDALGLPGMAVLQWAFGGRPSNPHALRNHRRNQVVYTSTHDTDTAAGWFRSLKPADREAIGLDPREPHWSLIELAMTSRASLAMIPAQDLLGLGSEDRMNRPGQVHGNGSARCGRPAATGPRSPSGRRFARSAGAARTTAARRTTARRRPRSAGTSSTSRSSTSSSGRART
jgi:4-alpha-glucanotransferase